MRSGRRSARDFRRACRSLYILLTSAGGRRLLSTIDTVIVDEIYALARDERGAHLALSIENADRFAARRSRPRPLRGGTRLPALAE